VRAEFVADPGVDVERRHRRRVERNLAGTPVLPMADCHGPLWEHDIAAVEADHLPDPHARH